MSLLIATSLLFVGCNRSPESQVAGRYQTRIVAGAGENTGGPGLPIMTFEFTENKMVKVVDMRGTEGSWRLEGDKLTFNLGPIPYVAKFRPEQNEIEIQSVGGSTDFGNVRYYLRKE